MMRSLLAHLRGLCSARRQPQAICQVGSLPQSVPEIASSSKPDNPAGGNSLADLGTKRKVSKEPCGTSAFASQVSSQTCGVWAPGSAVERLLDDVSDIWVGAVVISRHAVGDLYDIEYVDDASREYEVESHELRPRKLRFDLPAEVWTCIGSNLHDHHDICSFETISRMPCAVSQREAQTWWCTAYHEQFRRCGPRCAFAQRAGDGIVATGVDVADCMAVAALGLTPVDRTPWKSRYIEQDRNSKSTWHPEAESAGGGAAPGDAAYGVSGRKSNHPHLDGRLQYGRNALRGMYFDPRLGRMVREG